MNRSQGPAERTSPDPWQGQGEDADGDVGRPLQRISSAGMELSALLSRVVDGLILPPLKKLLKQRFPFLRL